MGLKSVALNKSLPTIVAEPVRPSVVDGSDTRAPVTLEQTLQDFAIHTRLLVGAHHCTMSFVPSGDRDGVIHAHSFSSRQYEDYFCSPQGAWLTGGGPWTLVIQQKKAMRMSRRELLAHTILREADHSTDLHRPEDPPMRSWIAAPVLQKCGHLLGVVQLSEKFDETEFSARDLEVLVQLANMLAPTFEWHAFSRELLPSEMDERGPCPTSVKNVEGGRESTGASAPKSRMASRLLGSFEANASLAARIRQLRDLSEGLLAIISSDSCDDVMRTVTEQARRAVGCHQAVASFTIDRNWGQAVTGLSLSDKYAAFRTYDAPPDGSGIYSMVCENNQVFRMSQAEIEAHPRWRGFGAEAGRHPPMRGWLAAPLIGKGGANIGLIQLSDKFQGDFTEEDELLTVQLAQAAAKAVEIRNARLQLVARVEERTAELVANQDRMDLALHSSGVGTWNWDIIDNFIIWDDFIHPLFGLEPRTFPGHYEDFLQTLHPDDRARVELEVSEAVGKDKPYETEYRVVWPDGSVHALGSRGKVYRDTSGRAQRMTGVCWDITARKRAEADLQATLAELERSNADLTLFASIASHDLQEPLRTVASFVDLLAHRYQGQLDDKADRWIAYVVDGAARMKQMIDDLLVFSRVTTQGKPFLPVDVADVVQVASANLQVAIHESGAQITHGPLPVVIADASQLTQLLQNLMSNAIKFRGAQPPEIHVEARQEADHWQFSVQDNGIGIDRQFAEKIFTLFQRLHTRDEYPGTGIGLALCKKIVERHGGRIWVDSTPGRGSVFYFTIRLIRGGQNEPLTKQESHDSASRR